MSEIKTDKLTGVGTAGSILVTGEGNSTTTSLQQGLAKAWVDFDGKTDTTNDSHNVASITDSTNGNFSFNVTNNFASSHFGSVGSSHNSGVAFGASPYMGNTATTRFGIQTANTGGTSADHDIMDGIVHGDLA